MAALSVMTRPGTRSAQTLNHVSTSQSTSTTQNYDGRLETPPVTRQERSSTSNAESAAASSDIYGPNVADKYGLPRKPWGSIDWKYVDEPQNLTQDEVQRDKDLDFVEGTMYRLKNGEFQAKREALLTAPYSGRVARELRTNPGPKDVERMYEALGEDATREYLQVYAENNRRYRQAVDGRNPNTMSIPGIQWVAYSDEVRAWAQEQADAGTLSPKSKLWEQVLGGKFKSRPDAREYFDRYKQQSLSEEQQKWLEGYRDYENRKYDQSWPTPKPRS